MSRDLVEPEGVNAGSADAGGTRDPVPGGDPDAGPAAPEPADGALGAPPEPAGNADDVYGSVPPA
jgi:hypothetical protein